MREGNKERTGPDTVDIVPTSPNLLYHKSKLRQSKSKCREFWGLGVGLWGREEDAQPQCWCVSGAVRVGSAVIVEFSRSKFPVGPRGRSRRRSDQRPRGAEGSRRPLPNNRGSPLNAYGEKPRIDVACDNRCTLAAGVKGEPGLLHLSSVSSAGRTTMRARIGRAA